MAMDNPYSINPDIVLRIGDLRATLSSPLLHDSDLTNIGHVERMGSRSLSGGVGPGGLLLHPLLSENYERKSSLTCEIEDLECQLSKAERELGLVKHQTEAHLRRLALAQSNLEGLEGQVSGKLKRLKKLGFGKHHSMPVRPLPLP